jgi:hypothetical protein
MSVIPFPYNLIVGAVAVLAIVSSTFFATRGHYIAQYDMLKAQYTQAGKDAQAAQDKIQISENYITKEAANEISTQLAAAANTHVNSLLNDTNIDSIQLCSSRIPIPAGLSAATPSGESTAPAAPVEVAIPSNELNDVLTTAIDNVDSLLILTRWEDSMRALEATK